MYPCLLFALNREAQPFYRHYRTRRRLVGAPCPAWLCGDPLGRVLVLETGVGAARCETALRWLTETYLPGEGLLPPPLLIAAGFAGALQNNWHVGDVLLASEVVDLSGRCWPRAPRVEAEPGGPWREGRLLSAPRIIAEAHEKQQLGQDSGAAAVDMESACAAAFGLERGIPFASVRVISDEVRTHLSPRLAALLSGSEVRLPRVLAALARAPWLLPELWRLARDTRRAAQRLADALMRCLSGPHPLLPPASGSTIRGSNPYHPETP